MRSIASALAALLVLSAPAWARIDWKINYEWARVQSSVEGKLLLVYFFQKRSNACKALEKESFKRKEVREFLEGVVCVRVDVKKNRENEAVASSHAVRDVPTLVLLDPWGGQIARRDQRPRGDQFVMAFCLEYCNQLTVAANADDFKEAARLAHFLKTWFDGTPGGEHADKYRENLRSFVRFTKFYERFEKQHQEKLAEARRQGEARWLAIQTEQAGELKQEADKLYRGKRARSYTIYKRIIARYPKTPQADEARKILAKHRVEWDEPG